MNDVIITDVKALDGYCLKLTFSDGIRGTVDLSSRILGRGGPFKPLEDRAYFRRVRINPQSGSLVWPNQTEFCPSILYNMITHIADQATKLEEVAS